MHHGVATLWRDALRLAVLCVILGPPLGASEGGSSSGTPPENPEEAKSIRLAPALVTIGDGVRATGDYNGADHVPFEQALQALPYGGTIVATGEFFFGKAVNLAATGLQILGRGATIHASPLGAFWVTAPDVSLDEIRFEDMAPTIPHAVILGLASGLRVRGCSFAGGPGGGLLLSFLQLVGGKSRWISNCTFAPDAGWTCVMAQNGSGLHVTGNAIDDSGNPAPRPFDYVFRGIDEQRGEFTGNVVVNYINGQAVVRLENTSGEKHHFVIAQNVIHTLDAQRIFDLPGARFDVVSANSIGRITGAVAVVDLYDSTSAVAFSNTITGNDFHNVGAASAIRVDRGGDVHITGNHFTLVSGTAVTATNASHIHVGSNEFTASGTPPAGPAIRILGGDGHAVLGNSFYDFSFRPVIDVQSVDPKGHRVQDNFTYP